MGSVPSPVTLAVHRGRSVIVVSEVATEELALELADSLARGGRFTTVRNGQGRLIYAKSSTGEIVSDARGFPADLHGWHRRIP